jgi:acyl carrier protein
MSDVATRLTRCFLAVFPSLDQGQASHATQESMEAWDSIASITLVRVVEEEFGVTLDLFELENLNSFAALCEYLEDQSHG